MAERSRFQFLQIREKDLFFFHQVREQLLRERAEQFLNAPQFRMLAAVMLDHLYEQRLQAWRLFANEAVMAFDDVLDQIGRRGAAPFLFAGWLAFGLRLADELQRAVHRNIGALAGLAQGPLAAAAIIDAERLENRNRGRVLDRDLSNRLLSKCHCFPSEIRLEAAAVFGSDLSHRALETIEQKLNNGGEIRFQAFRIEDHDLAPIDFDEALGLQAGKVAGDQLADGSDLRRQLLVAGAERKSDAAQGRASFVLGLAQQP